MHPSVPRFWRDPHGQCEAEGGCLPKAAVDIVRLEREGGLLRFLQDLRLQLRQVDTAMQLEVSVGDVELDDDTLQEIDGLCVQHCLNLEDIVRLLAIRVRDDMEIRARGGIVGCTQCHAQPQVKRPIVQDHLPEVVEDGNDPCRSLLFHHLRQATDHLVEQHLQRAQDGCCRGGQGRKVHDHIVVNIADMVCQIDSARLAARRIVL
mmetsp:Transcript_170322/g.546297  ORF Transcript_170322/g.546297 Transcript_170322/m.546297 type:complete len:206 (-) Transcript_170322:110-727(-)